MPNSDKKVILCLTCAPVVCILPELFGTGINTVVLAVVLLSVGALVIPWPTH